MLCEYCLSYPHRPGCPNAPESVSVCKCEKCGEGIFDGDKYYESYHGPLCMECMEDMTVREFLEYEGEDMTIAEKSDEEAERERWY